MRRAPFVASCNVPPSGSRQDQSESRACRDEQTELFEDAGRGIRLIVYLYFSVCAGSRASPAAQTALSRDCILRRDQNYHVIADGNLRAICVRDNYQPSCHDYYSFRFLSLNPEPNASCN